MAALLGIVGFLTNAAFIAAVISLALLPFRRWSLAYRVGTIATSLALSVALSLLGALLLLWFAPASFGSLLRARLPAEQGARAGALAETIGSAIDYSPLALVAALLASVAWLVARGRVHRAATPLCS